MLAVGSYGNLMATDLPFILSAFDIKETYPVIFFFRGRNVSLFFIKHESSSPQSSETGYLG